MKCGMLWFCEGEALQSAAVKAVAYYTKKYGLAPTAIYVNPGWYAESGKPSLGDGMAVHESNSILPHHLWIGTEE